MAKKIETKKPLVRVRTTITGMRGTRMDVRRAEDQSPGQVRFGRNTKPKRTVDSKRKM